MESSQSPSIGQIESGLIKQDHLALQTINFIQNCLPAWRDDPQRPRADSEKVLNPQLCKFLNSRARKEDFSMVQFNHEEPQVSRRHGDLAASPSDDIVIEAVPYTIYDPILIIECKRLPAPRKDREREYVTGGEGRNGGIQRFKLGLYASTHKLAVLLGYVQRDTAPEWHTKINAWIEELAQSESADECDWSGDENLGQLANEASTGVATCRSQHSRTGTATSPQIELHHIWIIMSSN